jgi:hypothetical protein
MSAPFRIRPPAVRTTPGVRAGNDSFKDYLERLLKMIPGEIVGLYLIGAGFIPGPNRVAAAVWAVICLGLLVVLRVYGTADTEERLPAQPVPVFVSAVAFIIWVYSLGGPFEMFGVHVPYIGSLAILLWSFLIPIFYKGG